MDIAFASTVDEYPQAEEIASDTGRSLDLLMMAALILRRLDEIIDGKATHPSKLEAAREMRRLKRCWKELMSRFESERFDRSLRQRRRNESSVTKQAEPVLAR